MSCIVLTASGNYWGEVSDVRRLLKWVLRDKVQVLRYDEENILTSAGDFGRSGTIVTIRMPLVVMLMKHFGYKAKTERIPFSYGAIYKRDGNICQYWHEYTLDEDGNPTPCKPYKYLCSSEDRTIDHVTPKSKEGLDNFENTVCCCRYCNERIKKNRTPEDAGLRLIRKPFVPVRQVGEFIIPDFAFNPKKKAHQAYFEIRHKVFTHRA